MPTLQNAEAVIREFIDPCQRLHPTCWPTLEYGNAITLGKKLLEAEQAWHDEWIKNRCKVCGEKTERTNPESFNVTCEKHRAFAVFFNLPLALEERGMPPPVRCPDFWAISKDYPATT